METHLLILVLGDIISSRSSLTCKSRKLRSNLSKSAHDKCLLYLNDVRGIPKGNKRARPLNILLPDDVEDDAGAILTSSVLVARYGYV